MIKYINGLILENAELKIRLEEMRTKISEFEKLTGGVNLEQRINDQKRRELVMAAAEELKAQGAQLQPIPYPNYFDLEGLNLTSLAASGLIKGSIAWLSRHARAGDLPHYRFKKDVWFDALDIKEVQSFEDTPTIAGKVRPIGYTKRYRATQR